MHVFDPSKLYVIFSSCVSQVDPIIGRVYTLTHSDERGFLFLDIGLRIAHERIQPTRDEVIGRWCYENGIWILQISVWIGADEDQNLKKRDYIFRRELPLALEAIFFGDRALILTNQFLTMAPIKVHFQSEKQEFNRIECWGTILDFMFC
ncbi:Staygreen protein [Amphibacillus marinus]|uniref:Staygreen protein n=1 Tax=Amphibacillus marinus TaxID=872970 RepID=A0A1H8LT36_9BACI|nr:staygreen family protein [Amphibacillus marinus]SEO08016.1 Staygreen protein [Amphibacillus marinus]